MCFVMLPLSMALSSLGTAGICYPADVLFCNTSAKVGSCRTDSDNDLLNVWQPIRDCSALEGIINPTPNAWEVFHLREYIMTYFHIQIHVMSLCLLVMFPSTTSHQITCKISNYLLVVLQPPFKFPFFHHSL